MIQRGNNRADIFKTTSDYELFMDAFVEAAMRSRVAIHGYTLMTNHVHLLLMPVSADGIPRTMQAIGRRYVYHFNRRHEHTGGLFNGRYRGFAVDNDDYWFACLRYVEMNPVRALLVAKPGDYRWTSYRFHAWGTADPIVTPHPLYLSLGPDAEARQRAWRELCDVPIPLDVLERLRKSTKKGRNTAWAQPGPSSPCPLPSSAAGQGSDPIDNR